MKKHHIYLLGFISAVILFFSISWKSSDIAHKGTRNYVQKIENIAVSEMNRTGVPASITVAQAILESDRGKSRLAKKGKNHFGIKCHNWEGEKIRREKDNSCFRVYPSIEQSFVDHSDFLLENPRYKECFDCGNNYECWAIKLEGANYAGTSRTYAGKLISIIEKNQLYDLDKSYNEAKQSPPQREKKAEKVIQQKKKSAAKNKADKPQKVHQPKQAKPVIRYVEKEVKVYIEKKQPKIKQGFELDLLKKKYCLLDAEYRGSINYGNDNMSELISKIEKTETALFRKGIRDFSFCE